MPIEFACSNCGKRLRVKDAAAGKRVRCPGCETLLRVPGGAAAPAPAAAPPSAPAPEMWYAKTEDDQTYGPVSRQELDEWAVEGRLTADSQVLREGSEQWQWATDIYPQLGQAAQPATAAPTVPTAPAAGPAVDPSNPFAFAAADTGPTARVGSGGTRYRRGGASGQRAPKSGAVTAIAIVNFVLGALQLLCGGITVIMGGAVASMLSEMDLPDEAGGGAQMIGGTIGGIIIVVGIISILFGICVIAAGFGVLQRAQWGRILTLVLGGLAGVLALLNLLSIFGGNIGGIIGLLMNGGYCAMVFMILLNRQYAAEFR
jgi:hypothetical protein